MANSALPAGCTVRPATLEDIPELSVLFRRRDEGLGLTPEPVESFLGWMLRLPYVRRDRDSVVIEHDGRAVAAATAFRDAATVGAVLRSEGVVDPSHLGGGLGGWLVSWLGDLARERRALEGPFDIHALTPAPDRAAHALLRAHGFGHIRTSWEMELELGTSRAPIEPPAGVTLRTFVAGRDERAFWRVHEEAFVDHFDYVPTPYESWEAEWYRPDEWDPSAVVFAEVQGEPVGVIAWVDAVTDGYIADVSVLPAHRRRGIGGALLRRAFDDIERAGKARATLTVDSENTTGAAGVYEAAGMSAYREWLVFSRSSA